jgi:hypothetical protein
MRRWQWFRRATAFSGAILLMSWLAGAIWSETLEYPRPCPGGCQPNVQNFGVFKHVWRRFPGEPGLDETNPHAVNSEVLPTPRGSTEAQWPRSTPSQPWQQPTPQPAVAPQAPQAQPPMELPRPQPAPEGQSPIPMPEGKLPTEGGAILPTPGTILPPAGTVLPPNPPEGDTKPTKPTIGGELPGLPDDEPTPPKSSSPKGKKSSEVTPIRKDATEHASEIPSANERYKAIETAKASAVASVNPVESPRARYEAWKNRNQPTVVHAVPSATGSAPEAGVASLAVNVEPERKTRSYDAHRADSIGIEPSSTSSHVEQAGYATAESSDMPEATSSKRAGPLVALKGYCPVELASNGRWVMGDLRWTVVHGGWIYRLSGAEQRKQFMANPDRFAPVYAGNDVVLAAEANRVVPGQTAYCAVYNNRLYMFSSAATQAEFNSHPERYAVGK